MATSEVQSAGGSANAVGSTDQQRAARSLELALAAARSAFENRGTDILVLNTRDLTSLFDYFVIATGSSGRQLHAMADDIDHKLQRELHDKRMGIEGYQQGGWVLLDYGTVVIHLFDAEHRDYYALEKLWGTAAQVPWNASA